MNKTKTNMTASNRVFLSYSSVDRIYAEKLAKDLQSYGVSVG